MIDPTLTVGFVPERQELLRITSEGKRMCGDREIKDLSRDELLVLINKMIDLMGRVD